MFLTLLRIHSWTRWLVLGALISGTVLGYLRYRAKADWNPYIHQVAVMVVDIQVAIGIVIWLFYDGWNRSVFFAVLHPAAMLLALAVAHAGFAIANKRAEPRSWLIMTGTSLVSLALIVAAIPWERL